MNPKEWTRRVQRAAAPDRHSVVGGSSGPGRMWLLGEFNISLKPKWPRNVTQMTFPSFTSGGDEGDERELDKGENYYEKRLIKEQRGGQRRHVLWRQPAWWVNPVVWYSSSPVAGTNTGACYEKSPGVTSQFCLYVSTSWFFFSRSLFFWFLFS